jgi:hypothetical protein
MTDRSSRSTPLANLFVRPGKQRPDIRHTPTGDPFRGPPEPARSISAAKRVLLQLCDADPVG